MKYNPILFADSYKHSHFNMLPPDARFVSSYIEARSGEDPILFFGLQMFLKEYFTKPFTLADVDEAEEIVRSHGEPFNRGGFMYILNKHGGYWPVSIQAVKEGTVLPKKNVLVQVVNTDPNVPWVTSFIETALLQGVWYPTTVATVSHAIKQDIKKYLELTSDSLDGLPFKLHDFGFRGVSSRESAGIGGLAHLVNFMGTDTIEALRYGRAYYGETMAAFSVPASEHSVTTAWGRDKEANAYEHFMKLSPNGIISIVSDSYDIRNAVSNIFGSKLKNNILERNGTVVIRPDSGNPLKIVPEVIQLLMDNFGFETNSKGYKVLPSYVRVIQGDGITKNSVPDILEIIENHYMSTDNVVFGMGGGLLQHVNRDTYGFAMKASAVKGEHDFDWVGINKEPATDKGKASKKGRLALVNKNGIFETVQENSNLLLSYKNLLEPVFDNGKLLRNQTLAEIRALSNE